MLIMVTAIPIFLLGYISYRYIYVVQIDKIGNNLQNRVISESEQLAKSLGDLSSASQLLIVNGGIGRDVVDFLGSDDQYQRAKLFSNIEKSLANVYYSNPSLGNMFYYARELDDPFQFANTQVNASFRLEALPLLYRANQLYFYGPHTSAGVAEQSLVFSLVRQMQDDIGNPVYVYLEMKLHQFEQILDRKGERFPMFHVITSADGDAAYSDLPEDFQAGQPIQHLDTRYKRFSVHNGQGWGLHLLIPLTDFNLEIRHWQIQFALYSLLTILLGLVFAGIIWRMVYRPLKIINHEISRFSYDQSRKAIALTGLKEFDHLIHNFQDMRDRIAELIVNIEDKERRRGQLEIEKLLVQINPHFIHNTLNTVQWLARMQGQANIASLISVFTRVLHYNLGKRSNIVSVREEVAALNDYMELQRIRYDHNFNIEMDIKEEALDISIPRFLLQPIVENALYHGLLDDGGQIEVAIHSVHPNKLMISVEDNGIGMDADRLETLFADDGLETRKTGIGIGLRYVKKMLEYYFADHAQIEVWSERGTGTRITLYIPDTLTRSDLHD